MEETQKDLYSLSVNKLSEDLIDGIINENPDSFSLIMEFSLLKVYINQDNNIKNIMQYILYHQQKDHQIY